MGCRCYCMRKWRKEKCNNKGSQGRRRKKKHATRIFPLFSRGSAGNFRGKEWVGSAWKCHGGGRSRVSMRMFACLEQAREGGSPFWDWKIIDSFDRLPLTRPQQHSAAAQRSKMREEGKKGNDLPFVLFWCRRRCHENIVIIAFQSKRTQTMRPPLLIPFCPPCQPHTFLFLHLFATHCNLDAHCALLMAAAHFFFVRAGRRWGSWNEQDSSSRYCFRLGWDLTS